MREKNTGILDEQKKEPWRAMIQSTGSALVWILILLVLGGLYLSVNAKAASAGRSYLSLEERVEEARRKNSELVAQLAEVTSPQRLNDLGWQANYNELRSRFPRISQREEHGSTQKSFSNI